jgi:hypothetical protein
VVRRAGERARRWQDTRRRTRAHSGA